MTSDDLFSKFAPFLTGALIFGGVLQATGYYSVFDLNVFEYLELSEILVLFINDLIINVFYVVLLWIFLTISIRIKRPKTPSVAKKLKLAGEFLIVNIPYFVIRLIESPVLSIFSWLALIAIIILATYIFNLKRVPAEPGQTISVYGTAVTRERFFFSAFLIIYFLSLFLSGTITATIQKNKGLKSDRVEILLKTNEYVNVDSLMYIGRTRNYTFLFNPRTKDKTVLSNDEIRSIKRK